MRQEFRNLKYHSYFVRTPKGELGVAYHEDKLIQGRVPVYLLDGQFNPVRDTMGTQQRILCPPDTLKVIGFVKE